jgi:hypothetical protein
MAGVTSARDLGGPLEESIWVRDAINRGEIKGPNLFVSGPFLQHRPYPGTEQFRWGVYGEKDAREKVQRLVKAGVDCIKLVDQDEMTKEEVFAIVDEAHNLFNAITNGAKNALALYDLIMETRNIRLIFMSGTPIINDPFELVPCFNMIRGKINLHASSGAIGGVEHQAANRRFNKSASKSRNNKPTNKPTKPNKYLKNKSNTFSFEDPHLDKFFQQDKQNNLMKPSKKVLIVPALASKFSKWRSYL